MSERAPCRVCGMRHQYGQGDPGWTHPEDYDFAECVKALLKEVGRLKRLPLTIWAEGMRGDDDE